MLVYLFMKKTWKYLKNCSAYTLVEMLVVVAIIGLISIPATLFFISNYTTYFKETNKMDVQQLARAGMDFIVTKMRQAQQSSIQVYSNTIGGNTTYELELIIEGTPNKRYTYYLDGTNLLQREEEQFQSGSWGNAASNQLIYNVTEFMAVKNGNLVTVTVRVKIDGINGYEMELKNSHKIRN
ncbi:MAG: hypothetical protein PWR27_1961 [Petroclostridium sp.]|nr:hypothetical protein [Clostridia bacterium]MDK2811252.1 hypothetical protein [Petroclostridium sp.]